MLFFSISAKKSGKPIDKPFILWYDDSTSAGGSFFVQKKTAVEGGTIFGGIPDPSPGYAVKSKREVPSNERQDHPCLHGLQAEEL